MKDDGKSVKYAKSFKEQFTLRGVIIGIIGSVILTCSSMFVALKASSLPFPIMFVVLVSMFGLKALGNTNVNEINVAHTSMSAGALVAGSLAFTIPGILVLNPDASLNYVQVLLVSVSGVTLGMIFLSLLRKHFVEDADLPLVMGKAAAEVVVVGDEGGKQTGALFGSLGIAGVFTALRDGLGIIPSISWFSKMTAYGSSGGMYWSPMILAIGYLIGPATIAVWFLGAVIGDFGILMGGQAFGLWDAATAAGLKSSIGIGYMVGVGLAITAKEIIPRAKAIFGGMFAKGQVGDAIVPMRWAPFVMIGLAFLLMFVLDLPFLAVVIVILGVWLTTAMSAQCVGQSAINPLEIFGMFIMAIAKYACNLSLEKAVFVAAIVATASGLTGDAMNDFKAGHILKSDPKAQWYAEFIGGIIGAVVSVTVLFILIAAYGGGVFGTDMFPAAQAKAVASIAGGASNVPALIGAMIAAFVIYFITPKFTMLGIGIFLPFYLSFAAFIGGMVRLVVKKVSPEFEQGNMGSVIASGLLGGEGFIGVVLALVTAIKILI